MKIDHLRTCIECGAQAQPVTGEAIYPRRPDLYAKRFWRCPLCHAYVGSHADSGAPLGRPAGAETRAARIAAHQVFDPLWRQGVMTRSEAYRWLAEALGVKQAHISWMDVKTARRVVEVCSQ